MTDFSKTKYSFADGTGGATENRSIGGKAYKPLIIIPETSLAGVELHIHLELDADFSHISGWNVQNSDAYLVGESSGRRALSGAEKIFLSAKFPGWNRVSTWNEFGRIKFQNAKKLSHAEWQANVAASAERNRVKAAKEAAREEERQRRIIARNKPMKYTVPIGTMTQTTFKKKKNQKLGEWSKLEFGFKEDSGVNSVSFRVDSSTRAVTAIVNYATTRQGEVHRATATTKIQAGMEGQPGLVA